MNKIVMLNVDTEIKGMVSFLKENFKMKIDHKEFENLLKKSYKALKVSVANAGVSTDTSTLRIFIDSRLMALLNELNSSLNCALDAEYVTLNKLRLALNDKQLERNVKLGKVQRKIEKEEKSSFKKMGRPSFHNDVKNNKYECQFKTLQDDLSQKQVELVKEQLGWGLKKQIVRSIFKHLLKMACHEAAEDVKKDVLKIKEKMETKRETNESKIYEVNVKNLTSNKFILFSNEAYTMRGLIDKKLKTSLIKKMVSI